MVGGGGRGCVAEVSTLEEEAQLSKGFGSLPEWSTLGWEAGAFMYSPTLGRNSPPLSGSSPHSPTPRPTLPGSQGRCRGITLGPVLAFTSQPCPVTSTGHLQETLGLGLCHAQTSAGKLGAILWAAGQPPKTSIQEATDWCPPGPRLPLHPARNPLCQAPYQMEMFRSRSQKCKPKK